MPVWIILGVCAAVFVLVVAVAGSRGVFDGGMEQDEPDRPRADRAPADASAADLADIRFTPALWGYSPAEVDRTMQVLTDRIADLEVSAARTSPDLPAPGPLTDS